MNLDELRPILAAYRAQVEPAWSPATAHPGYDGKAGDPAGQCGVTSAWLQRRLREDHGIKTEFCGGHVWIFDRCVGDNHCWLEVGEGPDRLVMDITADQMKGLQPWPALCSTDDQLRMGGIFYRAHRWPTLDELDADGSFRPRLDILTDALS